MAYPERSTTRNIIDEVFAKNDLTLKPAMEVSSPEAMLKLIETGLGAGVVPAWLAESRLKTSKLQVVDIPGVKFVRQLGLAHRKSASLSPAARAFAKMLQESCAE